MELGAQMLEHWRWQALKGVQWAAGHFDLADLQGNRKTVVIAIARENGLLLRGTERKKVADFEFRELRREFGKPEKRHLPVLHDASLKRRESGVLWLAAQGSRGREKTQETRKSLILFA